MEAIFAVTPSETIKYVILLTCVLRAPLTSFCCVQDEAHRRREAAESSVSRSRAWNYVHCQAGRLSWNLPRFIPCGPYAIRSRYTVF